MRSRLLLAGIMLALVAVTLVTVPIHAQSDHDFFVCQDGSIPYIVKKGDTVWAKAGKSAWEVGWAKLKKQNPALAKRPVDRKSASDIFVLLKEGEPLCGLDASGMEVRNANALATDAKKAARAGIIGGIRDVPDVTTTFVVPDWWWFLFVLVMLLLLWLFQLRRQNQEAMTHPATYGPPVHEGGISYLEPAEIATYMDRRAVRRFNAGRRVTGPHRVRLVGPWRFTYGDRRSRRAMCSGREEDRAYRAVYEVDGGGTQEQFTLVACGNDGTSIVSEGGHWIDDPLPQPTPPPPTWGLAQYRSWCARMSERGLDITRERLQMHLLNLEDAGFRITALDELEAERVRLLDGKADKENLAQQQKEFAASIRHQADAFDANALLSLEAAERFGQQALALQSDADLLHPRSVDTVALLPDGAPIDGTTEHSSSSPNDTMPEWTGANLIEPTLNDPNAM